MGERGERGGRGSVRGQGTRGVRSIYMGLFNKESSKNENGLVACGFIFAFAFAFALC